MWRRPTSSLEGETDVAKFKVLRFRFQFREDAIEDLLKRGFIYVDPHGGWTKHDTTGVPSHRGLVEFVRGAWTRTIYPLPKKEK